MTDVVVERNALDPYPALGVQRVVNCMGAVTFLGGLPLSETVVEAMRAAHASKVDLNELNAAVGMRIARYCKTEAGFVTSGATGALQLAAAACITGTDQARIARLPDHGDAPAPEIVLHRKHRITFDHALRSTGARLVEVGYAWDRTERWEFEAAFSPRTVAVFYVERFGPSSVLSLEEVVEIAHRRAVPVIVDAAVALPPRANLWEIPANGADLSCFSGGKAIGGPQNTGFVVGRHDLVAACALNTVPNHNTIGRSAKVNAEAMVGLITALDEYLAADEDDEYGGWLARLERMHRHLASYGVESAISATSKNAMPIPTLHFSFADTAQAAAASEALRTHTPPVWLAQHQCDLILDPHALQPSDDDYVIATLRASLPASPKEDS